MSRQGNDLLRRATLLLCCATLLICAPTLFAQGSLGTTDGLRLTLGSTGVVSSLQSSGVEYGTAGMGSGFLYRELPATVPNILPNGSFESGTTGPASWSWTNDSNGTWTWDSTVAVAGSRSMKVVVPGTTAKKSPILTSSTVSMLPNATYTLSFQTKSSGLSYPLTVFVLIQNSAGAWTQLNLSGPTGTSDWSLKKLIFTTSADAVRAYLQTDIYSGYGTAWLDDVQLTDVFGGRLPVAFGGSVTSDAGGLTQTASSGNGLNLSARFTSVGTAIRVDATLTDTTGQDRAVEVSFQLPLDVVGWSWDNSFISTSVVQDGVRYMTGSNQSHSRYPFATVRGGVAAFSLAVPMGPQMQRFSYDTVSGFRSAWDLGLSAAATKTASKAAWTFWIYTQAPQWGYRAAAQKYYGLDASSFASTLKLQGAWVLPVNGGSLSSVPGFQDFGWGIREGDPLADMGFVNQNGILVHHYVDPSGWFRAFPGYTAQPPYSAITSALNSDAATGTGSDVDGTPVKEMAQAVINSSPYNDQGLYQVQANSYFWYSGKYQIYPVLPDADIPAPSMWSVIKKYSVDGRISMWAGAGHHIDGIFLDNLTKAFSGLENYRRALWAYSDFPLTFSYSTHKVTQYFGVSLSEFCRSLRSYLNGKGMTLMGSAQSTDYIWVAPWLDTVGGEVAGAESADSAYLRRVLSYGKSWSNLYVPPSGTGAPTSAQVLTYFRQALLLGFFPGFNGTYWSTPAAYERDRAVFKQYMPLIKKIVQAGWRPVPYATSTDTGIHVERFDDQQSNTFYLTAQNFDTSANRTLQMTVDGASLQIGSGAITVTELVGNTTLSASRSGSNILFSDALAPGETTLYQITESGPPAGTVPANGSFEIGTGFPTGWTLGTSLTSGSWSWDASTAAQGTRSAMLVVPGIVSLQSPNLKSANFALAGSRTFTLSAWTRSSGVGGKYPPFLWIVELDSAGAILKDASGGIIQRQMVADFGTSGWVQKSLTFTTDPRCAQAYVYANIYKGYGTFWVDDIQVK